jgi:hypothetical protein
LLRFILSLHVPVHARVQVTLHEWRSSVVSRYPKGEALLNDTGLSRVCTKPISIRIIRMKWQKLVFILLRYNIE